MTGAGVLDWRFSRLLLQVALLLPPVTAERMCPSTCRCEGKLVYCESGVFRDVPANITASCQGLSLRYNRRLQLPPHRFARLRQLVWLYLDHNGVGAVHPLAFGGLRRLKELILSSNRISQLHNNTFGGVPNLRRLDLSHNQLQALQPGHLHGLRKLQNLHLRSNRLGQILARSFLECRSLELLDLGYNRLRSLGRTTFLGLTRLRELHLEHNRFSRISFLVFPPLASLQALYLQWNRIRAVGRDQDRDRAWIWPRLHKLDLSGNDLQTLDAGVFRRMPNLQTLNLESNKLSAVPAEVVASWRSLTSVGLAGNAWDCGLGICPLVARLRRLRHARDISVICSSPQRVQGERVLEAVRNYSTCGDAAFPPATLVTDDLPAQSSTLLQVQDTTPTHADAISALPPSPLPEVRFQHLAFHKVMAGSVALFLSLALIALVAYASWRHHPPTSAQQPASLEHTCRKKVRKQEPDLSSQLQEYFLSYNATSEAPDTPPAAARPCACVSGSIECQV